MQADSLPAEPQGKPRNTGVASLSHIQGIVQTQESNQGLLHLGFPGGSDGEESACNAGDLSAIPGSGRSLEKEMATHSSILAWKNPMDGGVWGATVHGVAKKFETTEQLHFRFNLLEFYRGFLCPNF